MFISYQDTLSAWRLADQDGARFKIISSSEAEHVRCFSNGEITRRHLNIEVRN